MTSAIERISARLLKYSSVPGTCRETGKWKQATNMYIDRVKHF